MYVPLKKFSWGWGATALLDNEGVWARRNGSATQYSKPVVNTTEHPVWVGNSKPMSWSKGPTHVTIVPESLKEDAGIITGQATVSVAQNVVSPLAIRLTAINISSPNVPSKISVPATVTIPAGSRTAAFPFSVADNTIRDEAQYVRILAEEASVPGNGYSESEDSIVIVDNE